MNQGSVGNSDENLYVSIYMYPSVSCGIIYCIAFTALIAGFFLSTFNYPKLIFTPIFLAFFAEKLFIDNQKVHFRKYFFYSVGEGHSTFLFEKQVKIDIGRCFYSIFEIETRHNGQKIYYV